MEYEFNASEGLPREFGLALREQGLALLKQYLKPEDTQALSEGLSRVLQTFLSQAGLETDISSEIDRDMVRLIKARPQWQGAFYDRLQMAPEALAFPSNSRITNLARTALDTDVLGVWPRMQIRLDLPQDEKNLIEWHTDYSYNEGTSDSYTMWIPLVTIEQKMGPILAALGTHKKEFTFVDSQSERRHKRTLPQEVVDQLNTVQPEKLSVGDVLIFHSKLVHTGMLNSDPERARLVAVFRMQNLNRLDIFGEGEKHE